MFSCNETHMHISIGATKQKLDLTVDVLLGILDVISQEVRQVVVQVLQQLHCITNEEDRVVFTKQNPLVAVHSQGLVRQKWGHSSPEGNNNNDNNKIAFQLMMS